MERIGVNVVDASRATCLIELPPDATSEVGVSQLSCSLGLKKIPSALRGMDIVMLAGCRLTICLMCLLAKTATAGELDLVDGILEDAATIKGGPRSEDGVLEFEDPVGTGRYKAVPGVRPAGKMRTNAAGDGTATYQWNRLRKGRRYRMRFPGPDFCPASGIGVKPDESFWKWIFTSSPSPNGGIHPVIPFLEQGVPMSDMDFIETWEDDAIWIIQLDPSQATWSSLGTPEIMDSEGDLLATVLSVTDSEVSFQIQSDPSPTTANSIQINNLGLNLQPGVRAVDYKIGVRGDVSTYINGEFHGSNSYPTTFFSEVKQIEIPYPPEIVAVVYRPENRDVELTWSSVPGVSYSVESSRDLVSWLCLNDDVPADGATTSFTHSDNTPGIERRFYRVRETPSANVP